MNYRRIWKQNRNDIRYQNQRSRWGWLMERSRLEKSRETVPLIHSTCFFLCFFIGLHFTYYILPILFFFPFFLYFSCLFRYSKICRPLFLFSFFFCYLFVSLFLSSEGYLRILQRPVHLLPINTFSKFSFTISREVCCAGPFVN